jgi:uncharacterized membrane protein HdeD (DUF308 family)
VRTSGEIINPRWLRIFQIIVGLICIALSAYILLGSVHLGAYTLIFLASTAFIIIGIERIIVGVKATSLKRSSRLISIGIGVAIVVYFGSGYFAPVFVSKLYVLILGFGLLATGAVRIIDGIKNSTYGRSSKIFTVGTGIICAAVALLVFSHPEFGFVLLLLIVSIVLLINGIQIAFVGITGRRLTRLRS